MIKIILCDDHKIVRAGLKELLSDCTDMKVVGEAGSGEDLLQLLRKVKTDLILLDISLPGRSGLDILKQIKLLYPDLPVLILSIHKEEQYAIRTIKANASGYLHKDSDPEELIKGIRTIARGEKYVSPRMFDTLVNHMLNNKTQNPHDKLSDREYEIMLMLAEGKSISQIANNLVISPNTVSTYRTRVMVKMNFNSNADLMKYVINCNINPSDNQPF